MESVVLSFRPAPPPVNRAEILRYAGAREEAGLSDLLDDCLAEAFSVLRYEVCYRFFTVEKKGSALSFGFAETESQTAARALDGCDGIVLFAATVGHGLDRLLSRYSRPSPVRALLLQAIGAERIESLCDRFAKEIGENVRNNGGETRPRFSPGYGDLPLAMQKEILAALDCQRRIGLTLNESLLMSPSKSVTAIIGIKNGRRYEN